MRHLSGAIVLGVLAMFAVACSGREAGPDDSQATPSSEDELATGAGARVFDCHGGGDGSLVNIELALSKSKATVIDLSKDAVPPGSGNYDASYAPAANSPYKDARRYLGFDPIQQGLGSEISDVQLMVSKELQSADHGTLWIRTAGPEGGGTSSYSCKQKPKPIAVEVSTKSRLVCSLSPMICTNDNPPGQTCLSDLLIMQKESDSADLRISWIDHFGVRVEDRKESVGASTEFSRTKTEMKAEWTGSKLLLNYRAGVTYLGTLEHGGKTAKVQCNDLAMLD